MKKIIVAITVASLVLGLNSLAHSKKYKRHGHNYNHGIINNTGRAAGNVVSDTGRVVDDAAKGTARILNNI